MLNEDYILDHIRDEAKKKYIEECGKLVVKKDNDGKFHFSMEGKRECCNNCSAFTLLPDPDPDDWFRDEDMKAVCLEVNGVIQGSLEKPSEWQNIPKPLYCPKLGRKLTAEEQKKADEELKWARKIMDL